MSFGEFLHRKEGFLGYNKCHCKLVKNLNLFKGLTYNFLQNLTFVCSFFNFEKHRDMITDDVLDWIESLIHPFIVI